MKGAGSHQAVQVAKERVTARSVRATHTMVEQVMSFFASRSDLLESPTFQHLPTVEHGALQLHQLRHQRHDFTRSLGSGHNGSRGEGLSG